jgi:hypothetical protein
MLSVRQSNSWRYRVTHSRGEKNIGESGIVWLATSKTGCAEVDGRGEGSTGNDVERVPGCPAQRSAINTRYIICSSTRTRTTIHSKQLSEDRICYKSLHISFQPPNTTFPNTTYHEPGCLPTYSARATSTCSASLLRHRKRTSLRASSTTVKCCSRA